MQDIYDEVRDYVDKLGTDKGGFMGFVASFNGIYSLGAPEENARAVEKRLKNTAAAGHSRPQAKTPQNACFAGVFFFEKSAAADCFCCAGKNPLCRTGGGLRQTRNDQKIRDK